MTLRWEGGGDPCQPALTVIMEGIAFIDNDNLKQTSAKKFKRIDHFMNKCMMKNGEQAVIEEMGETKE